MTRGKNVYRVARKSPAVTVLIAAADPQGERAKEALAEAGESVVRVETAAAALEGVDDADVVVLGELSSGSPAAVREAVGRPTTVGLGVPGTVEVPADATAAQLRDAVAEVRRAGDYRDAVDDLYERCRELAREGDDLSDEAVDAARERADEAFRAVREADDLSYSDILDED